MFETGDLLPAVQAGMAGQGYLPQYPLPAKFLFDRDIVNLVPYDRLLDRAEFTIAAEFSRAPNPGRHEIPSALESILGAFNIRQASALAEKMKYRKPDIYVHQRSRVCGCSVLTKRGSIPANRANR